MTPRFYYLNLCTAVLLAIGSGMAYAGDFGRHFQYKHVEIAQFPRTNKILKLNEEGIKLSSQGRFSDALQTLDQALVLSQNTGDRSLSAVTYNNIGRVHQRQGQNEQAFEAFLQALIINRELADAEKTPGQSRIALGKTYSNIGYLFDKQNQPELAVFFYKHCVNNRERVRLNPSALTAPQPDAYNITVAQTYRVLGEHLLKGGRVSEAQRILDLLKLEETEEYLSNVRGNQQTAKGVELMPAEKTIKQKVDQTFTQAVVLGTELTALRKISPEKRSPQQKQRIEQLVKLQQQILSQFNNFISRKAVREQLEQISRNAKRQNLDLESINEVRDNLARLPQKAVLIYPLVLKDSLELVIVTPDSPPIHRTVPVKRDRLNQTISAFRLALNKPSSNAKQPAQQLYDWLIKPIENDLKQAKAETIVYAPDDQLRYIPLSALYDGKQWLVQRFSINHITAASLTNFNTPRDSKIKVLAGAFTKGNYKVRVGKEELNFGGLPYAAQEVENVAAEVPGTKKLLDGAFSLQGTVPQMDDYTIVHFATHAAFVVGKPEESFILFGNGERATLRDVGTWSLPRVDLVVLSACETGLGGKLGNGEEILGFGYQMQKTGARSAIASLWAVDDGGTQALMSSFYTALSSGKVTKIEALRRSQIALITGDSSVLGQRSRSNSSASLGGSINHPYYWAPFILIGNGL